MPSSRNTRQAQGSLDRPRRSSRIKQMSLRDEHQKTALELQVMIDNPRGTYSKVPKTESAIREESPAKAKAFKKSLEIWPNYVLLIVLCKIVATVVIFCQISFKA